MPTKIHPLLRSDYCRNGHDISDKSMVAHRVNKKTGKDLGYVCRACLAVANARSREKRGKFHEPRPNSLRSTPVTFSTRVVSTSDPVTKNILARIERATETELLEIALFVAKLIPNKEKPEPDQE